MCSGQKLLQIVGIRRGLGERMTFELKEGKENTRKETEKSARAKRKAPKWKRTWFVLDPVGKRMCLKAWEPKQIGPGTRTCRWAVLRDENP